MVRDGAHSPLLRAHRQVSGDAGRSASLSTTSCRSGPGSSWTIHDGLEEKARLMRRTGEKLVPFVVLIVIGLACFARLIADPMSLIVDGRRPSHDFANHGDPRPVGNDLTFVFWPHHLSVAKALREFGHLPMWDSSGF